MVHACMRGERRDYVVTYMCTYICFTAAKGTATCMTFVNVTNLVENHNYTLAILSMQVKVLIPALGPISARGFQVSCWLAVYKIML